MVIGAEALDVWRLTSGCGGGEDEALRWGGEEANGFAPSAEPTPH